MKKLKKGLEKINNFFDEESRKIKKHDLFIIIILVLIYSVIAFSNLGDNKAPQTFYQFQNAGSEAGIELKETTEVSKIRYYSGLVPGNYTLFASNDGENYNEIGKMESTLSFSWKDADVNSEFKYLKIIADDGNSYLGEVALYDKYGDKLYIKSSYENSKNLTDETEYVPGLISYKNSMYFDEVYFARSAYEYIHDLPTNEWVHPPLGKLIQTLPILVFGMTPFAWRLMGTIAGILMIPVMYVFGKTIFKKRKYGLLAALLMMFDNFHFAQTRIGTVDSYLVLFIMLSALFMYKYLLLDKKEKITRKFKYLAISGLFFGLSVCVKWTGLYLGLGLAICFFAKLIKESLEDKKISKDYIKIIIWCILFFVLIPVFIYVSSYLLFPNVDPYGVKNLNDIFNQIKYMFDYHANLKEGHDFSSSWYTWILMYKPVWFNVNYYGTNLKSTIVAIGNPTIWWMGIPTLIYLLLNLIKNRKKELLFILTLIITTWLPYLFIGRCMFMYHFFPTLPFIMLGIVGLVKAISEKFKTKLIYIIYVLLVIFFFIYFFPVVSGKVVTKEFIDTLRWFSNWIF